MMEERYRITTLQDVVKATREAGFTMRQGMDQFQKAWLKAELGAHEGNQCAVAEALGMHRNTLGRLMDRIGLGRPAWRSYRIPKDRARRVTLVDHVSHRTIAQSVQKSSNAQQ